MISYKIHDIIIIHDIIKQSMISYAILQKNLFYPFLALIFIDITHDNIAEIMDNGYDVKNL
jgi:hypothetical protein